MQFQLGTQGLPGRDGQALQEPDRPAFQRDGGRGQEVGCRHRTHGTAHQHWDPFRHGLRKPGKEVCLPQGHAAQHQQAQRAHGAVEHIGRAGPQMQQFPAQQSLPQADGACFRAWYAVRAVPFRAVMAAQVGLFQQLAKDCKAQHCAQHEADQRRELPCRRAAQQPQRPGSTDSAATDCAGIGQQIVQSPAPAGSPLVQRKKHHASTPR